jgi:hypothetical protein
MIKIKEATMNEYANYHNHKGHGEFRSGGYVVLDHPAPTKFGGLGVLLVTIAVVLAVIVVLVMFF